MTNLAWHIEIIDKMIKQNKKSTIKDYFRLTGGMRKKDRYDLVDDKIKQIKDSGYQNRFITIPKERG